MALLIGMDEAGLGPNLGPFVVAVTVWRVPGDPAAFDFWSEFKTVLTNSPTKQDQRLFVADSKQVFKPHQGLGPLERGVWSALTLSGLAPQTFPALRRSLSRPLTQQRPAQVLTLESATKNRGSLFDTQELTAARSSIHTRMIPADQQPLPWYENDFQLPIEPLNFDARDRWRDLCKQRGIELVAMRADVVEPARFNRLTKEFDNKSKVTSGLAMTLLGDVWDPTGEEALIVADKHGGRNRYDSLLAESFKLPVECLKEGADLSAYRVGNGELRFQPRAEAHGPVALASMTAKYLREVAMEQFNQFWQRRIPGLKPTQGYPVDAKRFRDQIADEQTRLQISNFELWRDR